MAAAQFKTVAGDVYNGEVSSIDKDGLVIRLDEGGFSPRIDWSKLSDDTLKDLVSNPKAKRYVEPLIDAPAEEAIIEEAKKIELKAPPAHVSLPQVNRGILAALTSPNGLIFLGLLYLANIYAGFEVARFKWRPVPLVCGLSAVLPIVGPLIFLATPKLIPEEQASATEAALAESTLAAPIQATGSAPPGASGLGMSRGQHGGGGGSQDGMPKVFKRGETTFNRRFFETQFPTFFRVVASEADKDLVIEVDMGKQRIVANRISRISATEIHFKTVQGNETGVDFGSVVEVKLRHKDAA